MGAKYFCYRQKAKEAVCCYRLSTSTIYIYAGGCMIFPIVLSFNVSSICSRNFHLGLHRSKFRLQLVAVTNDAHGTPRHRHIYVIPLDPECGDLDNHSPARSSSTLHTPIPITQLILLTIGSTSTHFLALLNFSFRNPFLWKLCQTANPSPKAGSAK